MKVTTNNFQILKGKHEFEFPEGITIIQGKTGSGKTTLFYAIEDCLTNPSGVDDAINWDAKQASVTIENNGNKVTWIKTKTSSEYINENTGQSFVKASKLDSTDIADLGFYVTKNDVVNIQNEWKKLFPFDLKDTEMFSLFEDIFNISCSAAIIDDYKKDEKEINKSITNINDEINNLTKQLNNVNSVLERINEEDIDNYIKSINKQQTIVSNLQNDCNILKKLNTYKNIILPKDFDTIVLFKSFQNYRTLQNDLNIYRQQNKLQNLKIPEEKSFIFNENEYKIVYSNYKNLKEQINNYQQQIDLLNKQEQQVKQELKKIKICPTCGHKLEENNE